MSRRRYYIYAEHSTIPLANRSFGWLRTCLRVRHLISLGYKVTVIPLNRARWEVGG